MSHFMNLEGAFEGMDKFAKLISDIGKLWVNYYDDYLIGIQNTLILAVAAHEGLVILDFTATDDDFEVDQSEIDIGISVKKGNTGLKNMIDEVLSEMTVEDFNKLMNDAIAIQPTI